MTKKRQTETEAADKEAILEMQTRALAILVRRGEAEYGGTLEAEYDGRGNLIRGERRLYKVPSAGQYGLSARPRAVPRARKCCASCRHKDIREGGTRMCTLTRLEVPQCGLCGRYEMMPSLERI